MNNRLTLRGIRKSFGATVALDGVELTVGPGEIHAIIGENGAGKSTLMKVLSGAVRPDMGEILLDEQRVELTSPRQSLAAGIAMIYQELNLAPELTVTENIFLGNEASRWGWVRQSLQRKAAQAALAELNHHDIPLDAPVGGLPIAHQQMVEIARSICVTDELKLLILDEPTSSLNQQDAENLFAVMRRLRNRGVSVLYISHFLEECQQVATRFTVLRDGRSVRTGRLAVADSVASSSIVGSASPEKAANSPESPTPLTEIIHAMVGRELSDLYPKTPHVMGEPVLTIENLSGVTFPSGVNLSLRRGEIHGLAGLIGSGRTELVRAIFGLDPIVQGCVRRGARTPARRSPTLSWKRDRIGMVAEDRKHEGLLLDRSLSENLTLTRLEPFRRGPWLGDAGPRRAAQQQMQRLQVKAKSPDQAVGELSGGNQQKIAIGRLLHDDCEILLLDEPTRGIDIGSKRTIYETIGQLAADGKAILVVSNYLPELLGLCDTISVLSRGRLVATKPVEQWDEHSLLTAAL